MSRNNLRGITSETSHLLSIKTYGNKPQNEKKNFQTGGIGRGTKCSPTKECMHMDVYT